MERNTIQREETLKAVCELNNHPTAEEVYCEVSKHNSHISRGTVYRNLGILSSSGKIKKLLIPGNTSDRYDGNISPHCHAVCNCCGKVYDMELEKIDISAVEDEHFEVEKCDVVLTGRCSNCLNTPEKPVIGE